MYPRSPTATVITHMPNCRFPFRPPPLPFPFDLGVHKLRGAMLEELDPPSTCICGQSAESWSVRPQFLHLTTGRPRPLPFPLVLPLPLPVCMLGPLDSSNTPSIFPLKKPRALRRRFIVSRLCLIVTSDSL